MNYENKRILLENLLNGNYNDNFFDDNLDDLMTFNFFSRVHNINVKGYGINIVEKLPCTYENILYSISKWFQLLFEMFPGNTILDEIDNKPYFNVDLIQKTLFISVDFLFDEEDYIVDKPPKYYENFLDYIRQKYTQFKQRVYHPQLDYTSSLLNAIRACDYELVYHLLLENKYAQDDLNHALDIAAQVGCPPAIEILLRFNAQKNTSIDNHVKIHSDYPEYEPFYESSGYDLEYDESKPPLYDGKLLEYENFMNNIRQKYTAFKQRVYHPQLSEKSNLINAIRACDYELVYHLLLENEYSQDDLNDALDIAAQVGCPPAIEILLKFNAQKNTNIDGAVKRHNDYPEYEPFY